MCLHGNILCHQSERMWFFLFFVFLNASQCWNSLCFNDGAVAERHRHKAHDDFFFPLSLLYFAQFQQIGFATLQELRAAEGKANVCHWGDGRLWTGVTFWTGCGAEAPGTGIESAGLKRWKLPFILFAGAGGPRPGACVFIASTSKGKLLIGSLLKPKSQKTDSGLQNEHHATASSDHFKVRSNRETVLESCLVAY